MTIVVIFLYNFDSNHESIKPEIPEKLKQTKKTTTWKTEKGETRVEDQIYGSIFTTSWSGTAY